MRGGVGTPRPVDGTGAPIVRPYTPVSTNAMNGKFELMVKIYPNGNLTSYLDRLNAGDSVEFSHSPTNVKIQYPFNKPQIGMLIGGTCITPMIQALHAILGTAGDETKVTMLYASKTVEDILAKNVLDEWTSLYPERLSVVHVLSREPESSDWQGYRGHINQSLIEKYFPPPSATCIIFVCGPESHTNAPGFYDTYSGPRMNKTEIKGVLGEMGYGVEQVYKF